MSAPRRFADEEEMSIVESYRRGEKAASIAKDMSTCRGTVIKILHRRGEPVRLTGTLTRERDQEIETRYNAGEPLAVIARDLSVKRDTAYAIIRKRCGDEVRRREEVRKAPRDAWREQPAARLRNLLSGAKSNVKMTKCHLTFDDALFDILPANPPKNCTCCGVELDYKIYPRTDRTARDRCPSIDRCDNNLGYIVGNVYVLCWRCNRLKNDSTLAELQLLVAYVARHLPQR